MPYKLRKLPKKDLYRVYNDKTKEIHSYETTLENAKKQITLLNMIDAGVPLEKEGGNLAMDGKILRAFIGRVGSKLSLLDDIIPLIPPHKVYVELFVGGGSVFWNKEPAEKSVINDLDKDVVQTYRDIKKVPITADLTFLEETPIATKQAFVDKVNATKNPSPRDRLLKNYYMSKGTFNNLGFGKLYKNNTIKSTAKNFKEYKDLLKNTTITNEDYTKVIKKYDSPDTFFYLDPPYEESDTLYKNDTIDYEKMNDILKSIKGKFLLSINDSKYIRDIFKGFNQKAIKITNKSPNPIFQRYNRKELLISNYPLKKISGKGIELDTFKDKKNISNPIVSLPKFNSVDLVLPTYMYKPNPNKQSSYKWRLVVPTTKSRNLAKRKNEGLSVDISRKPVEKVMNMVENPKEVIRLLDFPPADQQKIRDYYANVEANIGKDPEKMPNEITQNKPRGFPAVLYKNAIRDGLTKDETTTTYRTNLQQGLKQPKQPKQPKKPVKVVSSTSPQPKKPVEVVSTTSPKPKDDSDPKYQATLTREDTIPEKKTDDEISKDELMAELGELEDLDDYFKNLEEDFGKGIKNNISTKNKKMNSWVQYVKDFASQKGIKYNEALKDPECKAGYKKLKGGSLEDKIPNKPVRKPDGAPVAPVESRGFLQQVKARAERASKIQEGDAKKKTPKVNAGSGLRKKIGLGKCGAGIVDEAAAKGYADQVLIATAYNQSNLGADNAGRKFISL